MIDGDRPFRILGWHLKLAREQLCESIDEVSGAVEIDTDFLERIEQGKSRPSEDVLMLLVNHLGLEDAEANSLWELAGFVSNDKDADNNSLNTTDPRIIYTDLVHIMVNDAGVVMNFLQTGNSSNQSLLVSRVGMSKHQARHMLKILQQTLEEPNKLKAKLLPPNSKQHKNSKRENQ